TIPRPTGSLWHKASATAYIPPSTSSRTTKPDRATRGESGDLRGRRGGSRQNRIEWGQCAGPVNRLEIRAGDDRGALHRRHRQQFEDSRAEIRGRVGDGAGGTNVARQAVGHGRRDDAWQAGGAGLEHLVLK